MRNRLVLFSCFSYYACAGVAGCSSASSAQTPADDVDAGLPAARDASTWSRDPALPAVSHRPHPSAHADAGRRAPRSTSGVADAAGDAGESNGPACVPEGGVDLPDDDFIDS